MIDWYTSGDAAQMRTVGARLWGEPIDAICLPAS